MCIHQIKDSNKKTIFRKLRNYKLKKFNTEQQLDIITTYMIYNTP